MKPTKKTINIFIFILTVNFINNTILIPILSPLFLKPEYNFFLPETTFEIRALLLGITLASYPTAVFIGSPITGNICDCIGRKKTLFFVTLITAFGNLITSIGIYFNHFYIIILGRLVAGITGGSSIPIKSIISDISDTLNRNKNFSCIPTAMGISVILGPFLGSALANNELVSWFNFSTPLWFLFLFGLINLPMILFYIKETHQKLSPIKIDITSCFKQINEIIFFEDLRFKMFLILMLSTGVTIYISTFQMYLIKKFDVDTQQIGYLYSYSGFVGFFVQIFVYNRLANNLKLTKIISWGFIINAFSILPLLFFTNYYNVFFLVIPTIITRTFTQASLISYINPKNFNFDRGKFYGYSRSIQALGELIGPIFGGIMITKFIWLPIVFTSIIMIAAFFVFQKILKQDLRKT
jgi:DHA1 family tetracycline resistance protein-like MFS transporter